MVLFSSIHQFEKKADSELSAFLLKDPLKFESEFHKWLCEEGVCIGIRLL